MLVISFTTKLRIQIKAKYSSLSVGHKVGLIYINIIIDVIMFITHGVVASFKEVLTRIIGKSVNIPGMDLIGVLNLIYKVLEFLEETMLDVINGLTKYPGKKHW